MNMKPNQILIGIILLLIGILSGFTDFINPNYPSVMLLFSGFAFMLLYRTKRKSWSLVIGMYLAYIGVLGLLKDVFQLFPNVNLYGAMFFIVPGLIFLILFLDKNRKGLLFPASILLWIGIYLCLSSISFLSPNNAALMYFCAGAVFFTVHFFSKESEKKWCLYLACGLECIAAMRLFGTPDMSFSKVFSWIFIGIGLLIIIKAIRK